MSRHRGHHEFWPGLFALGVFAMSLWAQPRIWELPISYAGRTYAEGKKIDWRDGLAAFWHILRFNLFTPTRYRK